LCATNRYAIFEGVFNKLIKIPNKQTHTQVRAENSPKGLSYILFGNMATWESVLREIPERGPFLILLHGNFIYGYMAI